jgi:tetratricopeptide (TPR) repeat protein
MQAAGRAHDAYTRAIELEAKGNYPAALSLLWEAAGLAPRDPDIQNRLGEALERMGALDAAIDAYRQAVTERAGFRKARNNLVLALVKAGRGPEAVDRARALVAEDPADPERYFTLGLAQSEQDVSEAINAFRRVLEIAPGHALARYNLALVLKRADRLPEALEELQRAREISIARRPRFARQSPANRGTPTRMPPWARFSKPGAISWVLPTLFDVRSVCVHRWRPHIMRWGKFFSSMPTSAARSRSSRKRRA